MTPYKKRIQSLLCFTKLGTQFFTTSMSFLEMSLVCLRAGNSNLCLLNISYISAQAALEHLSVNVELERETEGKDVKEKVSTVTCP